MSDESSASSLTWPEHQASEMLDELIAACGGSEAPIRDEPVTISANLAHGLIAVLAALATEDASRRRPAS